MHTTLIESKRRSRRSTGSTAVSVIIHAALITLVAAVTAHASDHVPATLSPPHGVVYIDVSKPAPPQRSAVSTSRPRIDPTPRIPDRITRHIEVPKEILTGLPPVERVKVELGPVDFVIGRNSDSDVIGKGGASSDNAGGTFTAWQVEKETTPLPGNPKPRYPSLLQSARVDGQVFAQFVVDTSGRVDMSTFTALEATNELFVDAVKRALAQWKFQPAEAGGRKVKQLVQMPLTFRVR